MTQITINASSQWIGGIDFTQISHAFEEKEHASIRNIEIVRECKKLIEKLFSDEIYLKFVCGH